MYIPYSEREGDKRCAGISGNLAYDPLLAQVNGTAPFIVQSTENIPVEIVWVGKPAVDLHVTAEICLEGQQQVRTNDV